MRADWDGDPEVINGTRYWETPVCRTCAREGDEIEDPCQMRSMLPGEIRDEHYFNALAVGDPMDTFTSPADAIAFLEGYVGTGTDKARLAVAYLKSLQSETARNDVLEAAAVRFESGLTVLKGDAAALAAGTLRGMKDTK